MDETKEYQSAEIQDELIKEMLENVMEILTDRGYNPINQVVGYLMSGDPGYITSHKEARSKITKFDRTQILEYLIRKNKEN